MKFQIGAADFSQLAKRAAQFAAHSSDINPGLSLVAVSVSDVGTLRMRAHTADSGVSVMHKLSEDGFEPGSAAFEVKHLEKIVAVVPPRSTVSVRVGSGPKASVRAGSLSLNVPKASIDEFFPLPKPPADGEWFKVPAKDVVDVARRVTWSMCSDGSRPHLAGVHLCASWSESSDGSLFSRVSPGIVPEGVDVVVRGDTLTRLRSMVEAERELSTLVDANRIWFRGNGWAMFSSMITDRYPNVSVVYFPRDAAAREHVAGNAKFPLHHVYVNRAELLAAVRRITSVSISSEESKVGAGMAMDMRDGGELHVCSDYPFNDLSQSIMVDDVIAWSEGSVTAADVSGFQSLEEVAFYAKYVSMALEAMSADVVRVMWADPVGGQKLPIQFQDDDINMSALVSPRRRGY